MIYLDKNDGKIKYTEDKNEILAQALLAELALFKGENPMSTNAGVDYIGVFNNEKFLKTEAEEVIDKYATKFDTIELGEIEYDDDRIKASISMTFKNGETDSQTWSVQ